MKAETGKTSDSRYVGRILDDNGTLIWQTKKSYGSAARTKWLAEKTMQNKALEKAE